VILYQSQLFENKRMEQSDSCSVMFTQIHSKSLSAQHTNFVNITFLTIFESKCKKSLASKPLLVANQPW